MRQKRKEMEKETENVHSAESGWESLSAVEKVSVNQKKAKEEFRTYDDKAGARFEVVENHYREMRKNQTVAFVERMYEKYHKFDKLQMSVWEAFDVLKDYVDSSDPDIDLPNIEHSFQTAEAIRKAGHPEWFQLIGLIHDMGKLMFLWGTAKDGQQGTAEGPQWALGGDTWIVGCRVPDTTVFKEFNALNPDMQESSENYEVYTSQHGIYNKGCGLANCKFAYGHDEYLYRMLVHNRVEIPEEGLAMIRYHSCYPWHKCGEYSDLMDSTDEKMLPWVLEFNKFDLYTKDNERPDIKKLRETHYDAIVEKYMPGKLYW